MTKKSSLKYKQGIYFVSILTSMWDTREANSSTPTFAVKYGRLNRRYPLTAIHAENWRLAREQTGLGLVENLAHTLSIVHDIAYANYIYRLAFGCNLHFCYFCTRYRKLEQTTCAYRLKTTLRTNTIQYRGNNDGGHGGRS